jgi:hypothetical protein
MSEDRSLDVRAVAAVFLSLACLTVVLRCYVRLFIVKAFGLDDGAMALALVSGSHIWFLEGGQIRLD